MDLAVHLHMKTLKYRHSRYELDANIVIPRQFRYSSARKREVPPQRWAVRIIRFPDDCPFHIPHGHSACSHPPTTP